MRYKQYSVVKLKVLNKSFAESDISLGDRVPKEGDLAAIVEVYGFPSLGYELECSNKNGITEWLATFSPEDAEFDLVSE